MKQFYLLCNMLFAVTTLFSQNNKIITFLKNQII